jgi:predicted Zn-dependent protease
MRKLLTPYLVTFLLASPAFAQPTSAEENERKLFETLRANPADTKARKQHAEALYQLGRYHYAVDECKVILAANERDSDALLCMAKSLQSMHRPLKAIDFYERFIGTLPATDQRAQQYKTLVQVLKDNSTPVAVSAEARAKAGDYLSFVSGIQFARWKDPAALKVYIKDGKGVEGYRSEFEESLRQAFDDWNESTGGKIGFEFVTDPSAAQMTVEWTSDLHSPALKAEAGNAQTMYTEDGIQSAQIHLLTVDPFKDGPIGKNHLYNICLHEIGHALGLQGHSPYPEDIMYSSLYTQQGLSNRDINTLFALYGKQR